MSTAADTIFPRAAALLAAGEAAPAAALFRQVLDLAPHRADAWQNLGAIALANCLPAEALAAFDAALRLDPWAAAPHAGRGEALAALGQTAAAIAALRTAIRLDPGAVAPLASLGETLASSCGRPAWEEAVQHCRRALALDPACVRALAALGLALKELWRLDEAEAALQAARRLAPEDTLVLTRLADLRRRQGRLDEAAAILSAALRLAPADIGARIALAWVHTAAERFGAAETVLRAVLADAPGAAAAHTLLGCLLLGDGRYGEGWEHYEWRSAAIGQTPEIAGANWDGTDLAGRTLLVVSDEGLGDFIQFCRYIPLAARQGRVVVQVQPPLLRLALRLPGVWRVVPHGATPPAFDLHCSATSLPRACRAGTQPILADIPYLRADPADVAAWRDRLAGLPGRKVGLVWAGNPELGIDPARSLPLAALAPLAGVAGVSFVSLQKGCRPDPDAGLVLHDWTDELLDFADTAALIDNLDLVIAVDTAVAHLAGALGRPVWLLNRWDGGTDPRWLRTRPDTPWYPTMRIFRQPSFGDWAAVIAAVRAALAGFAP